ncbi:Fcf2 pre-rRNA processing-domain-containing protein [Morchella snyderi]|nr:Fcf2 pre-rRNA processing-domain-containing protein [Morchella snyderi]
MPTEEPLELLQTAEKRRNIHDVVKASTVSLSSPPGGVVEDDDAELSDETINHLLREAEQRMRDSSALLNSSTVVNKISMTKFPKLDPGSALANAPIKSQGSVSRISDPSMLVSSSDRELADTSAAAGGISRVDRAASKKTKEDKEKTAGANWFDMPRTDLTPQLKRDLQLIKMRNVLDPHRHYKKDNSALPEYSQVGTIIEGNTEFFSSRITKKDRKRTIAEEIMADEGNRKRFKKKYQEITSSKRSGKKEFYRKLLAQRGSSKI